MFAKSTAKPIIDRRKSIFLLQRTRTSESVESVVRTQLLSDEFSSSPFEPVALEARDEEPRDELAAAEDELVVVVVAAVVVVVMDSLMFCLRTICLLALGLFSL